MKIETETKYDIGQKVYIVDQDFTLEHFVREVTIKAVVTRSQYVSGELRHTNIYLFDPVYTTLVNGRMVFEFAMFKTKEEAQAEANRLNKVGSE